MSLPRRGIDDDLALALELADLADSVTLPRFQALDLKVETKPDQTPVTEADKAAERAIRERLAASRAGDAVVGEEYGNADPSRSVARRWVIDPIDGTMGYMRGMPIWGTLLALQNGDETLLGVISAPALHRRWWAAQGVGAFVEDGLSDGPRQIRVSAVADLAESQLCLSAVGEWEAIGRMDAILELERGCWRTRGIGDLWSYMLVAEGAAELALDPRVALWDLAATQVIVEEAGGRFTDLGGIRRADGGDCLASNGLVHDAALAIIGR